MQVIGKIEEIMERIQRTETFSVREFVLEIGNPTSQYTEHVLFQTTNQRTELLNQVQIGQEVVVDFDLQGRKWTNPEGRIVFFNRLNVWRISPYNAQMQQPMQGGYQQQPMQGYQQQPMQSGYQQPQPAYQQYQQPAPAPQAAPAPAPAAPQAAPSMGTAADDDLPF